MFLHFQPLRKFELGRFVKNGKAYVVNVRREAPVNACIEQDEQGYLRCWATKAYLSTEAVDLLREKAEYVPANNAFVWKE